MIRRAALILAALILAVLAGPVRAAGPAEESSGKVERTDPRHMPPLPPGGYDLPLSPPVVRFPLPPQWVTIRSKEDWRKAGRVDKKLSDACAARKFRQLLPMRFRAVFRTDVLGVAFGHGLNLVDEDKLADKAMIYLFRNGDSTACVVVAMDNQDVNALRAAGAEVNPTGARR